MIAGIKAAATVKKMPVEAVIAIAAQVTYKLELIKWLEFAVFCRDI